MIDRLEYTEHDKGPDKEDIRAAMEISSFIGDSGIKVLPGKEWGVYYKNPQRRQELLTAVLSGHISPEQVDLAELKPVGLSYRLKDVETIGLNGMVGKVRDWAAFYQHFADRGFLDFLGELKGRDIDLKTATQLFHSIGKSHMQSELLRTLGATGKTQLKSSLRNEASVIVETENPGKMQSLLELLKLRWLSEKGIIDINECVEFEKKMDEETILLADELEEAYKSYVRKGDDISGKQLAARVKNSFKEIKEQVKSDELSEFIEDKMDNYDDLSEGEQSQIDEAFNDYSPPQNDTPPDFGEKFSPSMDEMKEGGEKEKVVPLYTVEPPLKGLYQGPIYSHFNTSQVEWEMRHTMQAVSSVNAPSDHILRGKIAANSTLSVYLPRHFAPAGIPQGIQLLRDENGSYFLRNNSGREQSYELAFGKQEFNNTSTPAPSETADISSGNLSLATRNYVDSLKGKNNIAKAQAIIHYMKNILKLEYSNDSKFNRIYKKNPSRYFLEIEQHKEVDCDVAQTYFIALCRLAGVPSRFILGHSVDLVQDGKALLHSGTGHAWTEIWDEKNGTWKTIDATPEAANDEQDGGQDGEQSSEQGDNAPQEGTDIEAPPQEQSDDSMSGEQVKKQVDDQVEKTEQDGQGQQGESAPPPDSAKEKMEKMMDQKSDQGQPAEGDEDQGGDEGEIGGQEWEEMEQAMEEMQKKHEEMSQKAQDIKDEITKAESFEDLKALEEKLEESELYEDVEQKLEEMLEAKEDQAKEELREEIEKMIEDGFLTEEEGEKRLKELESDDMSDCSKAEQGLSHESALYNEYEDIRQEILPLVDEWFEFFADRLPKIDEIDYADDMNSIRGRFDRRSIARPRNLLYGTTQNPAVLNQSVVPRFMASLIIDISGSMSARMRDARKLLIFFSELFDKISEEFGYIKFSIAAFDTQVELIKDFDYDYGSPTRYDFGGGEKTVKVRLMESTMARGGTDMGKAVWEANRKLNEAKLEHPDYLSALYTISDGATHGQLSGENLKRFLEGQQEFWGEWWGEHMKCGFMLGPESDRAILSQYFGEDNAESVPDIRDLIEKVMNRFDEDAQGFIANLPEGN